MRILIPAILFASFIFTGCSSSILCFQLISTEPLNEETTMTFQNETCLIEFDFWGNHGEPGFVIHNTSDVNLELNLDSCFYISNGDMYDLFLQREYTSSASSTSSLSSTATIADRLKQSSQSFYNLSGGAVASQSASATNENSRERGFIQKEKMRLIVTPGAKRSVSEYSILNKTFRYCYLQRNPYKKTRNEMSKSFEFSPDDSPLLFSIVVNYSTANKTFTETFDFYISRIENLKNEDVETRITEDECGTKLWDYYTELKDLGEKKFYIKYVIKN
jgi:hypothetical protein